MNILILSHVFRPNVGGMETHLDDLCNYLVRNEHKVYVITYQPLATRIKAEKLERRGNLEVRRIPWIRLSFFFGTPLQGSLLEFFYFAPALMIYSFIFMLSRRKEIDVIHAHGLISAYVASMLLMSKLFKKKSIVSIHWIIGLSSRSILSRLLMKIALIPHQKILTLSSASRADLVHLGLDRNRIDVFRYWVDQTVFKLLNKDECKRKSNCEHKFVVLFVGRFLKIKGIRLLIDVARNLSNNKDLCFIFAGDGPLATEVRQASEELDNVLYVGRVDNKSLNVYYNAADVVAVPSLYEEGYGIVILEALSCGTPVIASNRGGIPEALNTSVGVLIEPTAENLEKEIERLYGDPNETLKLAKNCRKYSEKRFSEKNAEEIEENYYNAKY